MQKFNLKTCSVIKNKGISILNFIKSKFNNSLKLKLCTFNSDVYLFLTIANGYLIEFPKM